VYLKKSYVPFVSKSKEPALTQVTDSEKANFSESLAPNYFELINKQKPRKVRFSKTARSAVLFFAASAAKFSKRDISSASERAFPGF